MSAVYRFKESAYVPRSVDPQAAGERIESLKERGLSTPADIVEDARPEDAPTHDAFTWDDSVAGPKWRLKEARELVNGLEIVNIETGESAPAFISLEIHETQARGYVSSLETLTDADYRSQMLHEAKDALVAWRRRYKALSELERIFSVIDEEVAVAA